MPHSCKGIDRKQVPTDVFLTHLSKNSRLFKKLHAKRPLSPRINARYSGEPLNLCEDSMAAAFYQTEQHLDRVALELPDGVSIRYQDLARLADHFAQHFVRNDIWPQQLCILQCRNNLMTIVALLSCFRHRRPVLLVPGSTEISQIQTLARQFECAALITPYGEVERLSGTAFHSDPELMLLRADCQLSFEQLLPFTRETVLNSARANADFFNVRATDDLWLTHSLDHPLALMQLLAAFTVGARLRLLAAPSDSKVFWQQLLQSPSSQLWLSSSLLERWLALPEPVQQRLQNPLRTVLPLSPTASLPRLGQWLCYYQEEALTPLTVNPDAWQLGFRREQVIGEQLFAVTSGQSGCGQLQFAHPYACQTAALQAAQLRHLMPSQYFDSVVPARLAADQWFEPQDIVSKQVYIADVRVHLRAIERYCERFKLKIVCCSKNQQLVVALVAQALDESTKSRARLLLDSLFNPAKLVYSLVILRDIPYLSGHRIHVDAILAQAQSREFNALSH